jgi:hypothetical protein
MHQAGDKAEAVPLARFLTVMVTFPVWALPIKSTANPTTSG